MFGPHLELLVIALIVAGIAFTLWKGGAANPVSTGGLDKKLTELDGDMGRLKTGFGVLTTRVAEFEERAATKGDIARIEARMADWERTFAKIDTLDDRLDRLSCDVVELRGIVASSVKVFDATAEGLRTTTQSLQELERKVEATAAVSAQMPSFIEKIVERQAANSSKIEAIGTQVDRLYHFLTEKALK